MKMDSGSVSLSSPVDPRLRSRQKQPPQPGISPKPPQIFADQQNPQQRPSDPRLLTQHYPFPPPPPFAAVPQPHLNFPLSVDQSMRPIMMQHYAAPPPNFHPAWRPHPLQASPHLYSMSHDQHPRLPPMSYDPRPRLTYGGFQSPPAMPFHHVAPFPMGVAFFSPLPRPPPMPGCVVARHQQPMPDAFIEEWLKRVGEHRGDSNGGVRGQSPKFMKVSVPGVG